MRSFWNWRKRLKATWAAFRDFNKPVPYKAPEPTLLASVPGDTVFALKPSEDTGSVNGNKMSRPKFVKGTIRLARIEENGSLSYLLSRCPLDNTWFPAHLCVSEDGYKRWLVGLLKEHGYKPLKMEHIQEAIATVVSQATWNDLMGKPNVHVLTTEEEKEIRTEGVAGRAD
jgi:hypothetical protein